MQGRRKRPANQEAAVDPAAEDELVCWPSMRLAINLDMQDTAGLMQSAVMPGDDRADAMKRMRSLVRLQYLICLAQTCSIQIIQVQALCVSRLLSSEMIIMTVHLPAACECETQECAQTACMCSRLKESHISVQEMSPYSSCSDDSVYVAPPPRTFQAATSSVIIQAQKALKQVSSLPPPDAVPLPVHTLCAHLLIHESS